MEIKIPRTNNFWVDNGIVAFYEWLESDGIKEREFNVKYNQVDVKMEPDFLFIRGERIKIRESLSKISEKFYAEIQRTTKNEGWYYDEQKNTVTRYKKTDQKPYVKFFLGQVPQRPERRIFFNAVSDELKKILEKENLKPYGLKKKYVPLTKMSLTISDIKEPNIESGKNLCDICGRKVKKVSKIKKQNFPFIVAIDKLMSFYSFGRHAIKMCYFCKLFSLLSLRKLFFKRSIRERKEIGCFFILYDIDFQALYHFSKRLSGVVETEYDNFDLLRIPTHYLHENLFLLIYNTFRSILEILESDRERGIELSKKWFCFEAIKGKIGGGPKIIFDRFFEFSNYARMIQLFEKLYKKEPLIIERIFGILYLRKNDVLRNSFCEKILNFQMPWDIIEEFLSNQLNEKNARTVPYLSQFVNIYGGEIAMDEGMIKICNGLGYKIGSVCAEKDNKSLLYDIRNVKKLEEFLGSLEKIQHKTEEVTVPLNLIKKIDKKNWILYKTLISIFGMNTFIRKGKKPKFERGEKNE